MRYSILFAFLIVCISQNVIAVNTNNLKQIAINVVRDTSTEISDTYRTNDIQLSQYGSGASCIRNCNFVYSWCIKSCGFNPDADLGICFSQCDSEKTSCIGYC